MTRPVLTPEEVAKVLRVSEWQVREWARTGVLARLPHRKVLILAAVLTRLG